MRTTNSKFRLFFQFFFVGPWNDLGILNDAEKVYSIGKFDWFSTINKTNPIILLS